MPRRGKWFSIKLPAQDNCDQCDIFLHSLAECIPREKWSFPIILHLDPSWYKPSLVGEKKFRMKFGDYAKVQNGPNRRNTISSRTHPEIAVSPTGNSNGTINLFCLITGRILKRRDFTQFTMPDIFILKKMGKENRKGSIWQFNIVQGLL